MRVLELLEKRVLEAWATCSWGRDTLSTQAGLTLEL